MKSKLLSIGIALVISVTGCTTVSTLKSFQKSLTTGCLNIGSANQILNKSDKSWTINGMSLEAMIKPLADELSKKGIDPNKASFHQDNVVYASKDCKGQVVEVNPESTKQLAKFFQ